MIENTKTTPTPDPEPTKYNYYIEYWYSNTGEDGPYTENADFKETRTIGVYEGTQWPVTLTVPFPDKSNGGYTLTTKPDGSSPLTGNTLTEGEAKSNQKTFKVYYYKDAPTPDPKQFTITVNYYDQDTQDETTGTNLLLGTWTSASIAENSDYDVTNEVLNKTFANYEYVSNDSSDNKPVKGTLTSNLLFNVYYRKQAETPTEWGYTLGKEATNLNENFISNITLSITPAKKEGPSIQAAEEPTVIIPAGSYVWDDMGYVKDDYNFDFLATPGADNVCKDLYVTFNGQTLYGVKGATWSDTNGLYTYTEYDFRNLLPEEDPNGETGNNAPAEFTLRYGMSKIDGVRDHFCWVINTPVTDRSTALKLHYSVKLTNPKTTEGTYGSYERYGVKGVDMIEGAKEGMGLFTNNEAYIYLFNDEAREFVPGGYFPMPTVSYTVEKSNPGPGPDPTPTYNYYSVTVNYLDKATGEKIAESFVQRGILEGTSYDVRDKDAIAITGYTYAETTGDPLSAQAIYSNKVINVYYTKDTTPVDPPVTPVDPPVTPVDPAPVDPPKTGDAMTFWVAAAAASALGLAALALTNKKRREDA